MTIDSKAARARAVIIPLSPVAGNNERFDVAVIELPKGTVWSPMSTESAKTIIVVKGVWCGCVAGKEVVLGPDQMFKVPVNTTHSWTAIEDTVALWIERSSAVNPSDNEQVVDLSGDPDQCLWGV